jgi:hypothetical protein
MIPLRRRPPTLMMASRSPSTLPNQRFLDSSAVKSPFTKFLAVENVPSLSLCIYIYMDLYVHFIYVSTYPCLFDEEMWESDLGKDEKFFTFRIDEETVS